MKTMKPQLPQKDEVWENPSSSFVATIIALEKAPKVKGGYIVVFDVAVSKSSRWQLELPMTESHVWRKQRCNVVLFMESWRRNFWFVGAFLNPKLNQTDV